MVAKSAFIGFLAVIFLIAACDPDVPTPETPKGDPAEAARQFIESFYSGDLSECIELSSEQIRLSVQEQCNANYAAQASIDLRFTTFEVISRQTVDRATIRMSGRWTISQIDPETGQRAIETTDTTLEAPVLIGMYFKGGKWRVDGIAVDPNFTPAAPTPS